VKAESCCGDKFFPVNMRRKETVKLQIIYGEGKPFLSVAQVQGNDLNKLPV
jgi:hypothetical protein